jgi:uncharacterized protein (DUF2062 family)
MLKLTYSASRFTAIPSVPHTILPVNPLPEPFWKRRLLTPILQQLQTGITPEKIALTIAVGTVVGVFPVLGSTTLLCALAAFVLRLNQPIIQLVNYLAYPLQLALVLGFLRAGESLFGKEHLPLSIPLMLERFKAGPLLFLKDFGVIAVHGIVVWLLVAPVVGTLLYLVLRFPMRALARRFPVTKPNPETH